MINKIKQFFCIHNEEAFFTAKEVQEGYFCPKCNKHFRYPGEESVLISKKYMTLETWKTNLPQISFNLIVHFWYFEFAFSFYIFCIRITIGE